MTLTSSAVGEDTVVGNGKEVDEVAVDIEHGGGDWNGAIVLSIFEDKPLSVVGRILSAGEADSQVEHSVWVFSFDCSSKYASNN